MIKYLGLILLVVSFYSNAETSTERTEMYFKDLKSGKYHETAGHFDAQHLREFRTMMEFYKEMPEDTQSEFIAAFFGPESTINSVSALDDAQFFASVFNFIMSSAAAAGGINFDGMEILGAVKEGEDVEHLVTRNRVSAGEIEVESMEIVSLRKKGGRWYLLMSGKVKGIPQQLKAAFSKGR